MRRLLLILSATFVLLGPLVLVPGTTKASVERHPLIRRAINALRSARTDLQNASHDYCGHRVAALEASNAALAQLQQALECDARRNSATGPEIEVAPESGGAAAGERHPNIYRAINALGAAQGDLQDAAHDYCGHRVAALGAVRSALSQLQTAIQCDKR
ncbi:MAG TPA: hypothetical protein VJX67_18360 [Blastocatellia bacterium]|nr:hypothetical protein [Blastocatellia bacterium]